MTGWGEGNVKPGGDDSDWNFDEYSIIANYKGTNLDFDMLYEPIISDN